MTILLQYVPNEKLRTGFSVSLYVYIERNSVQCCSESTFNLTVLYLLYLCWFYSTVVPPLSGQSLCGHPPITDNFLWQEL